MTLTPESRHRRRAFSHFSSASSSFENVARLRFFIIASPCPPARPLRPAGDSGPTRTGGVPRTNWQGVVCEYWREGRSVTTVAHAQSPARPSQKASSTLTLVAGLLPIRDISLPDFRRRVLAVHRLPLPAGRGLAEADLGWPQKAPLASPMMLGKEARSRG